jgi:acetyltransferase-like isoleucine patch superfamily enzyme
VKNAHYIEIGNNFSAITRFRIEAWDEYEGEQFYPEIIIGNNVCFNTDIHIGCINRIEIGDNCLFGSRIYITDHDHGETSPEDLRIIPAKRKLKSKGPVIIENNVYIGEGVAILSGVLIGENSIIATNSVVTKDVPKNTVVAGIPARVIKTISI